jgi:Cu(I)/Ag(I) efflux system membrane fusion protein
MSESPIPSAAGGRPDNSSRVWTVLRILNVRLRFVFLVGLVAGYWDNITNYYDRWRRPVLLAAAEGQEQVEYYCPMHPSVVRSAPGNCPICGMPLSQRAKTGPQALPEGVLARVELTPQKVEMGRIATTPIGYQLLSREIRTVGIVDYDETRRAFIAARIKGRIDQLMVNFVGQRVQQGDPLASVYSPDLLVAQRELIEASDSLKRHPRPAGGPPSGAETLVAGARQKLSLWGITDAQIDEIVTRGTPQTLLTIYSPITGIVTEKNVLEGRYVNEGDNLYTIADLSRVWMQAKLFDDQMAGVEVGQAVEVTFSAYPGHIFAGRIAFIAYTVDPATRTVAARIEVANPEYQLRPGMYVTAAIRLPVGQVTEAAPPATVPTASAPADAALGHTAASLARAYLGLVGAYVQDRTDAAAAAELARQARALAAQTPADRRAPVTALAEQAGQLEGKDLKAQRAIFSGLSARVIEVLRAQPPEGMTLLVAHCPMVNADWLQTSEAIANPYYGSQMLTCGSITGPLRSTSAPAEDRFASGYFCPIYPDRLSDQPQHCPIDGFPLKYVKMEKVLAVPEAAVIRTGTRKIVYKESAPGVFDMVAVKLGPRAGEFYPVLDGLEPGDQVATAGAFLVDAENRLNPAAGAQYFGASGGPQGSNHQH